MNQQCHKTRSLFGPHLDGELSTRATRRLEAHLEACPQCRAELEAEQQMADSLSTLPRMACPQRVDRKIMARLDEEPGQGRFSDRLGRILGSPGWKTVTACAAALVVVLLFYPIEPEAPVSTEAALAGDDGRITHQEAYQARQRAKTSLAYVAQLIQDTEKETVNDILSKKLPKAIRSSLLRVVSVKKGGSKS